MWRIENLYNSLQKFDHNNNNNNVFAVYMLEIIRDHGKLIK